MATPRARRATTPFGQAVRGPNPSQIVESTILTANPANLTRPTLHPPAASNPRRSSDIQRLGELEDDLWRRPRRALHDDAGHGVRAARQAETMEELEIDPPPARVSSSSGRGTLAASTPGYDPGSDDGMEYEDSDLEREADEYRDARAPGAGGGSFATSAHPPRRRPRADGSSSRRGFRGSRPARRRLEARDPSAARCIDRRRRRAAARREPSTRNDHHCSRRRRRWRWPRRWIRRRRGFSVRRSSRPQARAGGVKSNRQPGDGGRHPERRRRRRGCI